MHVTNPAFDISYKVYEIPLDVFALANENSGAVRKPLKVFFFRKVSSIRHILPKRVLLRNAS